MRHVAAGTALDSLAAAGSHAPATGRLVAAAVPADALLHPAALLALAALIVNDHWLKAAWPGLVTGKLSDLAGLIVFPLFLVGAVEVGQWLAGRWHGPDRRLLLWCTIATSAVFALAKTVPAANLLYEQSWGFLQCVPAGIGAAVSGSVSPAPWSVRLVADATDLLCLPAVALAYWIGRGRNAAANAT
jgi:hypothetical protein